MDVFSDHWQFWIVVLGFGGLIHNTARIYVRLGDILSSLRRIDAKSRLNYRFIILPRGGPCQFDEVNGPYKPVFAPRRSIPGNRVRPPKVEFRK